MLLGLGREGPVVRAGDALQTERHGSKNLRETRTPGVSAGAREAGGTGKAGAVGPCQPS